MKKFLSREGNILWTLTSLVLTLAAIHLGATSLPVFVNIILWPGLLGFPIVVHWFIVRAADRPPAEGGEEIEKE